MSEHDSFEQRLETLEQRLEALETENAQLRAQVAGQPESETQPPHEASNGSLSRRQALLRLGGVAAAAGVAATAVGLATNAPTARAADGAAVLLGQSNSSTQETSIADDGTANLPSTFSVTSNGSSANGAYAAITANAPLGGTGVQANAIDMPDGSVGVGLTASNLDESNNGSGIGAFGVSNSGVGVVGSVNSGIGGVFASATGWDLALFGTGRLAQDALYDHSGPPTESDGTFDIGEMIRDDNFVIWFSVAGPGAGGIRWVRPGMVNGATPGGAMNFLPSPVRIIGAGSPVGVPLVKNTRTNFTLAGSAGIPDDASAVFGNATVLHAGGTGFVTLAPKGGSMTTSSLNFTATDQPLSNFVAVGLNQGAITVYVSNNQDIRFIYDVVGYCL